MTNSQQMDVGQLLLSFKNNGLARIQQKYEKMTQYNFKMQSLNQENIVLNFQLSRVLNELQWANYIRKLI